MWLLWGWSIKLDNGDTIKTDDLINKEIGGRNEIYPIPVKIKIGDLERCDDYYNLESV